MAVKRKVSDVVLCESRVVCEDELERLLERLDVLPGAEMLDIADFEDEDGGFLIVYYVLTSAQR